MLPGSIKTVSEVRRRATPELPSTVPRMKRAAAPGEQLHARVSGVQNPPTDITIIIRDK